jgi:hypothetical protein
MRRLLMAAVLGSTVFAPARGAPQTFEGRAASDDGGVAVTYKVADGYKVSVTVDTRKKKGAYRYTSQSDVTGIEVKFVDLNRDSRVDVVVKHQDESGYSPRVLINRDDLSFVDALDIGKLFYVETEPEITGAGKAIPRGGFELKDVTGGGAPELIFHDVVIGNRRYRDATFRYDRRKTRYALHAKGASLGEVDEP